MLIQWGLVKSQSFLEESIIDWNGITSEQTVLELLLKFPVNIGI